MLSPDQAFDTPRVSVGMNGPGVECRWSEREPQRYWALVFAYIFSVFPSPVLFFLTHPLQVFAQSSMLPVVLISKFRLFFIAFFYFLPFLLLPFRTGWKVFLLYPDVALFPLSFAQWPVEHRFPAVGPADPGAGAGTDSRAPASAILQSSALLQKTPSDQVPDSKSSLTVLRITWQTHHTWLWPSTDVVEIFWSFFTIWFYVSRLVRDSR